MLDYAKLRKVAEDIIEPAFGDAHDRFFDAWGAKTVVAVLDERDALLAELEATRAELAKVVKPKPSKKSDYPPEFLEAMGAMERVGLKWLAGSTLPGAFKIWSARTTAGATPAELIMGADKYARFCKATDRRVMMAQTFFGPQEFFAADWTITKADARKGQIHGSIGKQDYSAGVSADGSF